LPENILAHLIADFDQQSIFRKEQTFVGVSVLFQRIDDASFRASCRKFFDQYKDAKLPLLNQVECALLRFVRKSAVVSVYPPLRTRINQDLQASPELARFVQPPTAFAMTFVAELGAHARSFEQLKSLSLDQLQRALDFVTRLESRIDGDFRSARSKLTPSEIQIGGFEYYGLGGSHYAFKNILHNFGIEPRDDPEPAGASQA
jgi:hypothetical protein